MMKTITLQQRAIGLCALLAITAFTTCVYAVWQWHSDWTLAHQELSSAPTLATTDEASELISSLPSAHLFGQASQGDVPISNLQFHLTGIMKMEGENNNASKAYISISGQPSKIYQVGDNLPYGVKVYDITPYAIILENDGHLEKLPLSRQQLQFKMKNSQELL